MEASQPRGGSWFGEPETYDFDQTPPGEWGHGG
jgi:hypothetical protein